HGVGQGPHPPDDRLIVRRRREPLRQVQGLGGDPDHRRAGAPAARARLAGRLRVPARRGDALRRSLLRRPGHDRIPETESRLVKRRPFSFDDQRRATIGGDASRYWTSAAGTMPIPCTFASTAWTDESAATLICSFSSWSFRSEMPFCNVRICRLLAVTALVCTR